MKFNKNAILKLVIFKCIHEYEVRIHYEEVIDFLKE